MKVVSRPETACEECFVMADWLVQIMAQSVSGYLQSRFTITVRAFSSVRAVSSVRGVCGGSGRRCLRGPGFRHMHGVYSPAGYAAALFVGACACLVAAFLIIVFMITFMVTVRAVSCYAGYAAALVVGACTSLLAAIFVVFPRPRGLRRLGSSRTARAWSPPFV